MLAAQLEEVLTAWGTWSRQVRVGPAPRMRCGSAERMHVAALGNLFDDEEPTEPRVNDELAMRVESAVIATGPVHSRALTMHYVERAPAAVIGRQLGLRDPAPVLERAHAEVARRLR